MTKIARIPLIANPFVSVGLLAAACAMLYAIGIHGIMKAAPLGDDFDVFYRAGGLFLDGIDPWLALMHSTQPYSYPPHSLSIVAAYNLFPHPVALGLHIAISLISIAVVCFCANMWFLHIKDFRSMTIAQAAAFALIIGNPYTATSLYQGQMTLPIMAALFLSWHFLQRDRWVIAGLLLGIATLKPQLSILYVVWLMLSLNIRVLMVGGLFAALLIAPGALVFGIVTPFESWLTSLEGYSNIAINAPGSDFVVGIESLLVAYGLQQSRLVLAACCLAGVGILFAFRRYLDPMVTLHVLLVLSFTFLYAHDYDYVAIILLWSFALLIAMTGESFARLCLYVGMAMVFFIPQRLIRDIDIPLIVHSRTLVLIALCIVVVIWSNQRRRSATFEGQPRQVSLM